MSAKGLSGRNDDVSVFHLSPLQAFLSLQNHVASPNAKMLTVVLAMHVLDSGASIRGALAGTVAARIPRDPWSSVKAVDSEREDEPPEGFDRALSAACPACRKNPGGEMRSREACRVRSEPLSGVHFASRCAGERSPGGVPYP